MTIQDASNLGMFGLLFDICIPKARLSPVCSWALWKSITVYHTDIGLGVFPSVISMVMACWSLCLVQLVGPFFVARYGRRSYCEDTACASNRQSSGTRFIGLSPDVLVMLVNVFDCPVEAKNNLGSSAQACRGLRLKPFISLCRSLALF